MNKKVSERLALKQLKIDSCNNLLQLQTAVMGSLLTVYILFVETSITTTTTSVGYQQVLTTTGPLKLVGRVDGREEINCFLSKISN